MTVSKSVRLPEELVEFVEALPGDNFTVKLVGLLEDLISGKDKRLQELQYLDERITKSRKQLRTHFQIVDGVHRLEGIYERLTNELVALTEHE